ncbi:hypothetical protein SALBM311S_10721 [Streptomyces alboniger]
MVRRNLSPGRAVRGAVVRARFAGQHPVQHQDAIATLACGYLKTRDRTERPPEAT